MRQFYNLRRGSGQVSISARRRGAFTLVELLVVIAIIGILIALLLPAIQAAREAARRTQCLDNLKNMGLACLTYERARKTLPPGKVVATSSSSGVCGSTGHYSNWAIEILPQMEELPLYKQYHFDMENWANPTNANYAVLATQLKVQTCPTDPNQPSLQVPEVLSGDGIKYMTSSYKGVAGRGWFVDANPAEAYWDSYQAGKGGTDAMNVIDRGPLSVVIVADPPSNAPAGSPPGPPRYAYGSAPGCIMGAMAKRPVGIKQISDGTSKTVLIGEYTTISQPNPYSRSAFWAQSDFGLNLGDVTLPNTTACRGDPLHCNATATTITLDPDFNRCATIAPGSNFPQPCRRTFSGLHGGGVITNFALCDGSNRGFSNSGDIRILAALATVAGGESVQVP